MSQCSHVSRQMANPLAEASRRGTPEHVCGNVHHIAGSTPSLWGWAGGHQTRGHPGVTQLAGTPALCHEAWSVAPGNTEGPLPVHSIQLQAICDRRVLNICLCMLSASPGRARGRVCAGTADHLAGTSLGRPLGRYIIGQTTWPEHHWTDHLAGTSTINYLYIYPCPSRTLHFFFALLFHSYCI